MNSKDSENTIKKKNKKPRCNFPGCNKKLDLIDISMGPCKCKKFYCSKHRNEITHNCTFNWQSSDKKILNDKLMREKCVAKQIEVI